MSNTIKGATAVTGVSHCHRQKTHGIRFYMVKNKFIPLGNLIRGDKLLMMSDVGFQLSADLQ